MRKARPLRRVALLAGLVSAGAVFLAPQLVGACSCLPASLSEVVGGSTNVFRARVLRERPRYMRPMPLGAPILSTLAVATRPDWAAKLERDTSYRVRILASYKGRLRPGRHVTVTTARTSSLCGVRLDRAADVLLTATRASDGTLRIGLCGFNVPFSDLTSEEVALLESSRERCDGQGRCVLGGAVGGPECGNDGECATGQWCRPTEAGGRACVSFARDGEACGGFVLPWAVSRCAPGSSCEPDPSVPGSVILDAPGICVPE